MIEILIYNYLKQNLSVPAYIQKPKDVPDNFVFFEKTGSMNYNHITTTTIAFQSYGKSRAEAAMLNEELKEVVNNMVELKEISAVRLNSDYEFTDLDTKHYRYQAVFDITTY